MGRTWAYTNKMRTKNLLAANMVGDVSAAIRIGTTSLTACQIAISIAVARAIAASAEGFNGTDDGVSLFQLHNVRPFFCQRAAHPLSSKL